ncbi:MAG TPA: hypothetical protein VIL20_24490 [Sandaracinaceae bacterium]
MTPRSTSGNALAIAVGLLALVLTVAEVAVRYVPHTWIQRDGRFYVNVNTTLVERASVDQGEFAASWYTGTLGWNRNLDEAWSNIALGRNGEHLPKHPILMPLLSTPLFWAFGLHGTLIFNVLLFALIAAGAFAIARRYASLAAAAFAAVALPLATGVRDHAYDYHVDVLILALFVAGFALACAKRGLSAGLLVGACVVLRPTSLLWVPSLALVLAAERDFRTLGRALVGGAIPLVLFALSNTWLFGRPWWSGYNRVLVVVDGVPQVADVSGAFGVPLAQGLETLWSGPYGVRHRLPLAFAALPGLLFLVRRKPAYVVAAVAGVAGSVVVFAQYRWYGDRFLWPNLALLVPALAVTFDRVARVARRRPWWRPAVLAALCATCVLAAHPSTAAALERHRALGTSGELALSFGLFALLALGLARAAERAGAGAMAIAAPMALSLLPGVRERVLAGGADLQVAAALCLALGARSWAPSLVAAGAAAWLAATTVTPAEPALLAQLDAPHGRPILLLLVLAGLALPALGRWSLLLLPLATLALPRVAALGGGAWPLFALALLCLPLPILALRAGGGARDLWRGWRRATRALAVASVLAALFAAGLAPRLRDEPFRIASFQGVRSARVRLREVPCDFLAWEHLNWECSHYDRGVHGETGLATSQPLHVGGVEQPLFLITTQQGRERVVRWERVRATEALELRWAVPDEMRGGGVLVVRANDRELATIVLSRGPDSQVNVHRLDTRELAGRDVSLELELRPPATGVLVDGGFVP